MIKYILFIILGIVIYILLNNVNRFSIGVPYETETRTFYNPDVPIYAPKDIEYIKWRESEYRQDMIFLDGYRVDEQIPPIYLGRFKKDPEDGGFGLGWRHFFIIDKKLYYFKEITENGQPMLKPKNYGNRDREPIVLISDDLSASATHEVTERTIRKSYLTITGTNDRVINMYNNIQTVQLAKSIIEQYTQFVIDRERAGNVTTCSVDISTEGIIQYPDLTYPDLTSLLELPSITAPEYSIDLTTIANYDGTTGLTLCDRYDSVLKINLGDVTVSDMSSDILVGDIGDINKSMIPVFEYNGILLIHIQNISSGSYGTVLIASNISYSQFNKTVDEGRVAIALSLKIYRDQNDTEIALIESINSEEIDLSNCLQVGELVGARIIETQNPNIRKVAIMDIMEGSLYDMVTDPRYKVNHNTIRYSALPLEIIKRICIMLKCIKDAGYSYTDLKLRNILFKCYRDRKLLISMGDLGSMFVSDTPKTQTIWTMIPPINEPGFNNNNGVVWIFGLIIIELYKITIWGWYIFNVIHLPNELGILNPKEPWYHGIYRYDPYYGNNSGKPGYFDQVRPAVSELMRLFDDIKDGTNDIEIEFIKDLLGRIFVPAEERITLEGIQQELERFSG